MEESIIVEGKTSTEAIEKGLRQLKCKKEDVDIKILENEDKRSFYSILEPRVVKVEITIKKDTKHVIKSDPQIVSISNEELKISRDKIEDFLNKFKLQVKDLEYNINQNENTLEVIFSGDASKSLIGYRGETINAIQNILSAIANRDMANRVRILVDIGGYKKKREERLKELARKLEKTVKRSGQKVILEPMTSFERKIIHTELQSSQYVTTYSIGEEPRRKVVVDKK